MLRREFVDTDVILEADFGMPIREVFETRGEPAFRKAEGAPAKRLCGQSRLVVVAGGGMPENPKNRAAMRRSGKILHIDASFDSCVARLSRAEISDRPLWQDEAAVRKLFELRTKVYSDNDIAISSDGKDPQEIARAFVRRLFKDVLFTVRLGNEDCIIVCSWDAVTILDSVVRSSRIALLTDTTVAGYHLAAYREAFEGLQVIEIPPGEDSKSLDTASQVYRKLLDGHFDHDDMLVALGGGVVTDLGAFVASTFKRGMRLVLVSTTLLGCVDAAVGGKAAVNLGEAKNIVGCFSTPEVVILDLAALGTLERSQISEGLIEAYKTGLIYCPELAQLVEREAAAH